MALLVVGTIGHAANAQAIITSARVRSVPTRYVPSPFRVVEGIQYGPRKDQLLDLLYPTTRKPAGVVVWAHGGGWVSGNRLQARTQFITRWIIDQGWVLATFDYRLTDASGTTGHLNPFPAAIADAQVAARWARANLGVLNLGPKIVLGGWSAGGNIAVMASLVDPKITGVGGPPLNVDGILSVAGITDMKAMYDLHFSFYSAIAAIHMQCRHVVDVPEPDSTETCDPSTLNTRLVQASAATHLRTTIAAGRKVAPVYLIAGMLDPLVKPATQATAIARLWRLLTGRLGMALTDVMTNGGHNPRFVDINADKLSRWLTAIRDGALVPMSSPSVHASLAKST